MTNSETQLLQKKIADAIAEWEKGCSVSPSHPEDCSTCTKALVEYIKRVVGIGAA